MKSFLNVRPTVRPALAVATFLWPCFVSEHDCVFVAFDGKPGFNAPPKSDTATGWESFVNHTHVFDEFRNKATKRTTIERIESLEVIEETYDDTHPDFVAACELGKRAALLWAMKLKHEFPNDRFRVYYTEYDNPIIRFHKVRDSEAFWISDNSLKNATTSDFRNAIAFDTNNLSKPILGPKIRLQ